MTSVTDTKLLLEHNSMPFAGALPGGEELTMQAAVSSAISLKRIAVALESIANVFKGEPEGFAMFINERMRAIASEQLEAINGITDQLECLTHEMMTLRKIYEARGN